MAKMIDTPPNTPDITWSKLKDWLYKLWKALQNFDVGVGANGNTQVNGNFTVTGNETVGGTITATGGINIPTGANLTGMPLSILSAAAGMDDGEAGQLVNSPTVACFATNSTQPSIPNNAFTTVTGWGGVSFNPGGGFNGTTGLYTVPQGGYYYVSVSCLFNNATWVNGQQWQSCIIQNGSQIAAFNVNCTTTGGFSTSLPVTAIVQCKAGDTIGLQAYQNSGGARNLYLAPYIYLIAIRIGS